jgi:hypothetical protein
MYKDINIIDIDDSLDKKKINPTADFSWNRFLAKVIKRNDESARFAGEI